MADHPAELSPLARGYQWAFRIITLAFGMVVPGLIGLWADKQLGWTPALTSLGFLLGMMAGMWRLVQLANSDTTQPQKTAQASQPEFDHSREDE